MGASVDSVVANNPVGLPQRSKLLVKLCKVDLFQREFCSLNKGIILAKSRLNLLSELYVEMRGLLWNSLVADNSGWLASEV